MKALIDLRTNHLSGVWRFGSNLAIKLASEETFPNLRIAIVGNKLNFDVIHELQLPDTVEIGCVNDEIPFHRDSTDLLHIVSRTNPDVYFTPSYIYDLRINVPVVFTIHDVARLNNGSGEDMTLSEFETKYGKFSLAYLEKYLQCNGNFPDSGWNSGESTFRRYFRMRTAMQISRAAGIVTVTNAVARQIECDLGIDPRRLRVVPNGVDTACFFRRSVAECDKVLNRYSIGKNFLLYVGLPNKRKRIHWLINALTNCISLQIHDFQLVMVGLHLIADAELQNCLAANNLTNKVIFTGRIDDTQLAALYSSCNALVIPSSDEGFCIPALEGAVCGAPVIVPDLQTIKEVIGDYGMYFPVGEFGEFCNLVEGSLRFRRVMPPLIPADRFEWGSSAAALLRFLGECACGTTLERAMVGQRGHI